MLMTPTTQLLNSTSKAELLLSGSRYAPIYTVEREGRYKLSLTIGYIL